MTPTNSAPLLKSRSDVYSRLSETEEEIAKLEKNLEEIRERLENYLTRTVPERPQDPERDSPSPPCPASERIACLTSRLINVNSGFADIIYRLQA